MKVIFTALCVLLVSNCLSQKKDTLSKSYASFSVKFDMSYLDKDDAIIFKGYVINIGYEEAKRFNGKKIRITGKVTVINSSKNQLPGQPPAQERQGPYRYIEFPMITIISE